MDARARLAVAGALLAVCLAGAAGCRRAGPTTAAPPPVVVEPPPGPPPTTVPRPLVGGPLTAALRGAVLKDFQQLGQFYHNAVSTNGKPPANLKELGIATDAPKLHQEIESGRYKVNWGLGLMQPAGTSNVVLAYWEGTPHHGGPVLMLDGSAKTMTKADFEAAPKGSR